MVSSWFIIINFSTHIWPSSDIFIKSLAKNVSVKQTDCNKRALVPFPSSNTSCVSVRCIAMSLLSNRLLLKMNQLNLGVLVNPLLERTTIYTMCCITTEVCNPFSKIRFSRTLEKWVEWIIFYSKIRDREVSRIFHQNHAEWSIKRSCVIKDNKCHSFLGDAVMSPRTAT